MKRRIVKLISRIYPLFMRVNFLFRNGSRLYRNGQVDRFGLPEVFIVPPYKVDEIVPGKDQQPVLTGRKIPLAIRASDTQVVELMLAGVL